MKRISKILSILMVAVMLFSFTAVPTSAALDTKSDVTVKYVFKDALDGNVITKASKGQVVWLYIVLNWDMNVLNFQNTFKFDKNVLTLVRKSGAANPVTSTTQSYTLLGDFASAKQVALTEADGDLFTQDDENNMMGYYTTYGAGTKTFNHDANFSEWSEAEKAQYQAYTMIYTSNLDDTTNQLLVNTHGADLEFCYMRFKVNEDTVLTKALIEGDAAFDAGAKNNITITNDQSWYFVPYAKTNYKTYVYTPAYTSLQIGSTTPSVAHDKTMGQMKSWASLTGPFNGGLVGRISNLDLTFDANDNCNEIKKIEVTITTSGGSTSAEAYTVYKQADGSYLFRAVIKNMTITDEETLTCTYAVTKADDTVIYSDPFTTTAKQMYDTALANYTAANP